MSLRKKKTGIIEKIPDPYGQRMSPTSNPNVMYVDWTVGFGLVELDGGNPHNTLYIFRPLITLKLGGVIYDEICVGDEVSFAITDKKMHNEFNGFDYILVEDIKLIN